MQLPSHASIALLRATYVGLFLWFGIQQVTDPTAWISFLPEFTGYLPIPGEILVQLNGWLEICLAALLAAGVYTRAIAAFLALHLLGIAITAGGATGVRDTGLAMIGIALALQPTDPWTLDARHQTKATA